MKNPLTSIFAGLIIIPVLASCAKPQPEIAISETVQPSQTPTSYTATQFPTLTQSPTPTGTPTVTFTPDFSPPIATKTLLPSAVCPQLNQNTIPDFTDFESSLNISTADDLEKAMEIAKNSLLTYMSAGGTISNLEQIFQKEQSQQEPNYLGQVQAGEITGDGVLEVFVWLALPGSEEGLPSPLTIDWIKQFFPMPVFGTRTFVFECNQGKYDFLGTIKDDYYNHAAMPTIADLNANAVGEIVQPIYDFAGTGYSISVSVLNWNGSEFINSVRGELTEDWMSSFSEGSLYAGEARVRSGSFSLQDIDNNGTTEVVISSYDRRGGVACETLYRETKMILMWNGDHFIGFYQRTPPIYRIQAVWDGDQASLQGLTDQAFSAYQKVLEDKTLLPWSRDYKNRAYPLCNDIPESTPIPANAVPDKDEASRLEAYSLYRRMLLEIVQADFSSAEDTYKLLQDKYQNGYSELAKIFWDNYSSTKVLGKACEATMAYAEANPEKILVPIGWYTYGSPTSNIPVYLPEDICPYK